MPTSLSISISNRQTLLPLDFARLRETLRGLLAEHGITRAALGIAIVGDAEIAEMHGRWLKDPTPTDVLSFPMGSGPARLEGEIAVSAETAIRAAADYGLAPADEVLLYAVHGTLHLLGYDDHAAEDRRAMRAKERATLAAAGVTLPPVGATQQTRSARRAAGPTPPRPTAHDKRHKRARRAGHTRSAPGTSGSQPPPEQHAAHPKKHPQRPPARPKRPAAGESYRHAGSKAPAARKTPPADQSRAAGNNAAPRKASDP